MKLSWPTSLVLCVALVVIGSLMWRGVDPADLVVIVLLVLGTGGGVAVGKIGQQTNGTATAMLDMMERQRQDQMRLTEALARAQPVQVLTEPRSQAPVGDPVQETQE